MIELFSDNCLPACIFGSSGNTFFANIRKKSLFQVVLGKKLHGKGGPGALSAISRLSFVRILSFHYFPDNCLFMRKNGYFCKVLGLGKTNGHFV